MNVYEHKGEMFAIIDGEMWVRLAAHPGALMPVESEQKVSRAPKLKQLNQVLAERKERKRRNTLGPEAEDTIRTEIRNGLGLTETCKKYEISVSTFYRLKNEDNSKPVIEE